MGAFVVHLWIFFLFKLIGGGLVRPSRGVLENTFIVDSIVFS